MACVLCPEDMEPARIMTGLRLPAQRFQSSSSVIGALFCIPSFILSHLYVEKACSICTFAYFVQSCRMSSLRTAARCTK